MALLSNVLAYARTQTQTDSVGLTDTNGIIWANEALYDFHRKLVNGSIDASQTQEAYRDGVVPSTTENGSTFLYPSDMMFLKAIEVNYTDTSAMNYITAKQVDVANLAGAYSFSWLRVNGSKQLPQFDDRGDWFEIFPSFTASDNITRAIRIFYFQNPTEFTATSDTIAYPMSLDYRLLSWRIAASYLYSLGVEKIPLADKINSMYEERVKELIETLGRGSQQPLQATAITIDGWAY